ncbi:class III extradiol ring-cleavage dioxygenase [Calidifontibacter terrae]
MPVLYLSHGAPPLADDTTWTSQLASWSKKLPKPENVLIVSAHWENNPITVSSTTGAPLTYDFWGFPQKYYDVTYYAPPAQELAHAVARNVAELGPVQQDPNRGLDHGAYVPMVEMFPDADVPVLQVSMPTLDPQELFGFGQKLASLRDEGTLIIGSGFTTHNLSWFHPSGGADATAPAASQEFDHWAAERVAAGDVDGILDWMDKAPAALEAHPRSEHWAPLFVSLGASSVAGSVEGDSEIDGFWFGLSKRSWTFN